jgi:hypothetical protein
MKFFFPSMLLLFLSLSASAQKRTHWDLMANLNTGIKGLSARNEGLGFRFAPIFFAQKFIQLRGGISYHQFMANRASYNPNLPGPARRPMMVTIEAGPQHEFSPKLAASVSGGIARYRVLGVYDSALLIAASIDGAFGPHEHLLIGIQYSLLPGTTNEIRFFSLKLGYRII